MSKLREFALEMRQHGWLERFRNASDANQSQRMSPFSANEISRHVDKLLDLVLEETQECEHRIPLKGKPGTI